MKKNVLHVTRGESQLLNVAIKICSNQIKKKPLDYLFYSKYLKNAAKHIFGILEEWIQNYSEIAFDVKYTELHVGFK